MFKKIVVFIIIVTFNYDLAMAADTDNGWNRDKMKAAEREAIERSWNRNRMAEEQRKRDRYRLAVEYGLIEIKCLQQSVNWIEIDWK